MKSIHMNFGFLRKFNRHLRIQLRYLTLSKLTNVIIAGISYLFCLKKLRSRPFLLKVEPSSFCNLKCLGCRTGTQVDFKDGIMPLDRYKAIIDELRGSLIEVVLYLWGEPFINKNLVEMVSYTNKNNIGSVISTNMHFMSEAVAEGLVRSKLDKLIVCIDGLDQETYEQIRTDGNLETVMKNLDIILDVRKKAASKYPMIEWQFIRTKTNEHQIEKARELASQKGIDVFTVMEDLSNQREKTDDQASRKKRKPLVDRRCTWLWFALAVQWDGSIYPCCHFARHEYYRFGQMSETSFKSIWNSKPFIQSRSRFADPDLKGDTICFKCIHYPVSGSKRS